MSINSIGKLQGAVISAITSNSQVQKVNLDTIPDSFELSQDGKLREALKEAFKFCQESVSGENPVESQIALDKTGKVLYTKVGSENTCKLEYEKLTPGSIVIHSHPDKYTFSIEDIMVLVTKPNLQKIGSVDPQGRTCFMEKPENYTLPDKKTIEYMYNSFCAILKEHWENAIGVVENPKLFCLKENEKRLMDFYGCSSEEELYEKLNLRKTGNIEVDLSKIISKFYSDDIWSMGENRIKPLGEWGAESAAQAFRIDEIKATPKGIEIGNQLMELFAYALGFKFTSGQI